MGILLLAGCNNKVTKDKFESIDIGYDIKKVEEVLGKPDEILSKSKAKDELEFIRESAWDNYAKDDGSYDEDFENMYNLANEAYHNNKLKGYEYNYKAGNKDSDGIIWIDDKEVVFVVKPLEEY
ncbi:hypothetical protein [Enterococcus sp. DIV0755b]|uniref:hypothetical protein n=1 Tax=Enterococcus sp. DIV0755b TaxID=2774657 RepID=UPI003F68676A